ncbi:DnaB-like helicase C-terminal domain-containing protein [Niallia sp. FSL R7-0271]|uniref:DnaB-like helicase C-terminal domain-containing protein n=1 Tax=Niallia sp. FSL R7-0271 TaxID=2921678 RepID=UPI0030F568CE
MAFIDLVKMTRGWHLIIVAARPFVGEIVFALHMGAVNCRKGDITTFFSLEMADKQLAMRWINSEGELKE